MIRLKKIVSTVHRFYIFSSQIAHILLIHYMHRKEKEGQKL